MEQNVTFNKLLYFIKRFADNSRFINTYGFGNLVEFGKDVDNTTPLYPLLFVVPNSVEYNENTTTYGLTIFLADKLNDDLEGAESIISNMSMVMRDLISTFKLSDVYMDIADFSFPLVGQPFLERFNDMLAGVSVDFNFTVSDYMEICEIEDESNYTLTLNASMLEAAPNNYIIIYEYASITGGSGTIKYNSGTITADTQINETIILNPNKYYGVLSIAGGNYITSGNIKAGNETIYEVECETVFTNINKRIKGDVDIFVNMSQSYDCPPITEITTEDGQPITVESTILILIT